MPSLEGGRFAQAAPSATILLVEDEVLLRFTLADMLRGHGFTVIEAASAEEALALLNSRTKIELVFSDIRLPGAMDGLELARTIRADHPEMRLLLTSGTTKPAEADQQWSDGFFAKPYDAELLVTRIAKLLDQAVDLRSRLGETTTSQQ